MYLTGVRVDAPREARLKRIATLGVPENMREQLVRIVSADAAATVGDPPRATVAKPRANARSVAKRPQQRRGS
jgi:hypothetical protein